MTRTQTNRLVWNGVIYGAAFAVALLISAFLQPPHKLAEPTAALHQEQPLAQASHTATPTEAALHLE